MINMIITVSLVTIISKFYAILKRQNQHQCDPPSFNFMEWFLCSSLIHFLVSNESHAAPGWKSEAMTNNILYDWNAFSLSIVIDTLVFDLPGRGSCFAAWGMRGASLSSLRIDKTGWFPVGWPALSVCHPQPCIFYKNAWPQVEKYPEDRRVSWELFSIVVFYKKWCKCKIIQNFR